VPEHYQGIALDFNPEGIETTEEVAET